MDRRTALALAFALFTPAVAAQQSAPRVWRIGYIGYAPPGTDAASTRQWETFLASLRERGFVEGRNIAFELRFFEGRPERFPALAAELVARKVDLIVVGTGPGVRAAKDATSTIPIVMNGASDPIAAGLVQSLAHPGGNVTGIADLQLDLVPKRLELLKAAAPGITSVVNITGTFSGLDPDRLARLRRDQDAAAQALGLRLTRVQLSAPQDYERVRDEIVRARPDAVLASPNPINFRLRDELATLAAQQHVPLMAARRDEAVAGALMSYGPSATAYGVLAASFVARILGGARPADLPVEQPTQFELVIHLKSAKALGLTFPQSLLLRADEVIQ